MGKINSRAKGKSGERELILVLRELLPEYAADFERNLEQTRGGGHDILGLPGWAIEVKRYGKVSQADLKGFWSQACEQARKDGGRPALAYREDRQDWRVIVRSFDMQMPAMAEDIDHWDLTCEMGLKLWAHQVRSNHV
jgi:hypothetical protein